MSEGTYKKAKYIYENADKEMIKQLDDGKLSINGAYVSLKNKAKENMSSGGKGCLTFDNLRVDES